MTSKLGPKPLFMRESDVALYYKVDTSQAAAIVKGLRRCGWHGREKLYAKKDIEAKIKEINNG